MGWRPNTRWPRRLKPRSSMRAMAAQRRLRSGRGKLASHQMALDQLPGGTVAVDAGSSAQELQPLQMPCEGFGDAGARARAKTGRESMPSRPLGGVSCH